MLPLATQCHTHYYFNPFHFIHVLLRCKYLVAKQPIKKIYSNLYNTISFCCSRHPYPESVVQRGAAGQTDKERPSSPRDGETTPPIRSTECRRSPVRKATAKEKKKGTKPNVSPVSTTVAKCMCIYQVFCDGHTINTTLCTSSNAS